MVYVDPKWHKGTFKSIGFPCWNQASQWHFEGPSCWEKYHVHIYIHTYIKPEFLCIFYPLFSTSGNWDGFHWIEHPQLDQGRADARSLWETDRWSHWFVARMMGYIGDFRRSNWCRFFSVAMGRGGCCPSVWWFLLGWRDIDFRSRGRICWPFPSQVGRSILVGACGSLLLRWYNLGTDDFLPCKLNVGCLIGSRSP